MKCLALLAMFAMFAACVPSGADTDARGAAAFVTEPSAATRGEAFTTDDGWTVTISRLAVITQITAQTPASDEPAEERYLWDATTPSTLVVRAIPTGSARLSTSVQSAGKRFNENGVEVTPYLLLGVSSDIDARLRNSPPPGGGVYLVAHAEKAGKSVLVDALVSVPMVPPDAPEKSKLDVFVAANDVTYAHLEVHAETLLQPFQPIADVADEDGRVAALRARRESLFTMKP